MQRRKAEGGGRQEETVFPSAVPRSSFPIPHSVFGSVFLLTLVAAPAFAHNPDTSYARFAVTRTSFEAKFVFDVTSLIRIVPNLDADADRRLTRDELQQRAATIGEFLKRTIRFEIDGRSTDFGESLPVVWPPDAGDAIAEKDYHAPTSLVAFTFRKSLAKPPADFWVQFEFFETLGERHTVLGAITKDAVVDEEVLFSPAEPEYLYDTLYVEETPSLTDVVRLGSSGTTRIGGTSMDRSANRSTATGTSAGPTRPGRLQLDAEEESAREPSGSSTSRRRSGDQTILGKMREFFGLGVEHIFIGTDHILFLLALIIVSRLGELVKIVTAFTVAHSITLALATLEIVEVDSQLVETAIAATIVYTALENLWLKDSRSRWRLTFAFGLIHGFGFAGVLRELGLPSVGYVRSLAAFNVGVEAGQLAIVAALWLPMLLVARSRYAKPIQNGLSLVVALCGLGWFLDRAFDWALMPF